MTSLSRPCRHAVQVLTVFAAGLASLSQAQQINPVRSLEYQVTQVQSAQAGASPDAQRRVPAATRAASSPAPQGSGKVVKNVTTPLWTELTADQRSSLAPLAVKWDTLSAAQKRKWIALSANFPKMPESEQGKLHSRMTEWVALSPQQRAQARLNFGETQNLSADDKKAQWEAYQALPPEEKKKLAAGAAKPPATAAAVKPVAPEKMAAVPRARSRSTAASDKVDRNTLLPQPAPARRPTTN